LAFRRDLGGFSSPRNSASCFENTCEEHYPWLRCLGDLGSAADGMMRQRRASEDLAMHNFAKGLTQAI